MHKGDDKARIAYKKCIFMEEAKQQNVLNLVIFTINKGTLIQINEKQTKMCNYIKSFTGFTEAISIAQRNFRLNSAQGYWLDNGHVQGATKASEAFKPKLNLQTHRTSTANKCT